LHFGDDAAGVGTVVRTGTVDMKGSHETSSKKTLLVGPGQCSLSSNFGFSDHDAEALVRADSC
jgi:hypothetical protein